MITWGSIARSVVTRFLPGIATFVAVAVLVNLVRGYTDLPSINARAATLVCSLVAGYVVALGVMRAYMHDTANAERRRTYFVGIGAMSALLLVSIFDASPPSRYFHTLYAFAATAATTALAFAPLLRRSMAYFERRANGQLYADVVDLALTTELAKASTRQRVSEA